MTRILSTSALALSLSLAAVGGAMAAGASDQQGAATTSPTTNPNASVYENANWSFDAWDRDDDGSLSQQEIVAGLFGGSPGETTSAMSRSEFQSVRPVLIDTIPDRSFVFSDVDADGNAEITDVELLTYVRTGAGTTTQASDQTIRTGPHDVSPQIASAWDIDGDGRVTRDEWQEIMSDPTGAEDGRSGVPGYGEDQATSPTTATD